MGDLATLPTFQPAPAGYTAADFNAIFAALTIKAGAVNANAIADASITLAKLGPIAASTLLGNATGAAAVPQALTINQARNLLALPPNDAASNNGLFLNVPAAPPYGHLTFAVAGVTAAQIVSVSAINTSFYFGAEFTGNQLLARAANPIRVGANNNTGQLLIQSDTGQTAGNVWAAGAARVIYDGATGNVTLAAVNNNPIRQQLTIANNVAGGMGFLSYAPGNNQIYFGAEFTGGAILARHTGVCRMFDQGNGLLTIDGGLGQTIGSAIVTSTRFTFDYGAGIFTAVGRVNSAGLTSTEDVRISHSAAPNDGALIFGASSGANYIQYTSATNTFLISQPLSSVNFTALSARRYKENVQRLEEPAALDLVRHMRPVIYDEKRERGGKSLVGFIAEELDEVLPGMVARDEHGRANAINYGPLVAVMAGAIKELTGRMDRMERSAA